MREVSVGENIDQYKLIEVIAHFDACRRQRSLRFLDAAAQQHGEAIEFREGGAG